MCPRANDAIPEKRYMSPSAGYTTLRSSTMSPMSPNTSPIITSEPNSTDTTSFFAIKEKTAVRMKNTLARVFVNTPLTPPCLTLTYRKNTVAITPSASVA